MAEFERPPSQPHGSGDDSNESVLARIERISGTTSRILLRESPRDATPVLRVPGDEEPESIPDDLRYEVQGEIARGGVGVIFKCRDKDLGREVALKVLRRDHVSNDEVIQRFVEEAQIGGQLQHPGIVPIYGLGLQEDGRPFFAMRLVRGRTLAALLDDRESPREERRDFLSIFEQICQTMAYAHARGVIHRDLKPANIMVGAFGEVQVMDWGFSKVLGRKREPTTEQLEETAEHAIATVRSGGDGSHSMAGAVMGTPSYMPPEQALGRVDEIDERCDVFALGALLCEILSGKPPYDAEGKEALFMAAQGRLEDAFERLDGCEADPELVDLARRCLSAGKKERPRDAGAVARVVTDHLAELEERTRVRELRAAQARAKEQQEREQAQREQRSRRRGLAVIAALLMVVLGGGGAFLWVDARDRDRRELIAPQVRDAILRARGYREDNRWAQADEAARVAFELAHSEDVGGEILAEVEKFRRTLVRERDAWEQEQRRTREDARMVTELTDAGACWGPAIAPRMIDRAYARAFEAYGLDLDNLAPAEAAASLDESEIHGELCAAIDDWIWIRRTEPDLAGRDWRRLLETVRRADPDPWRNQLRGLVSSADPIRLTELKESSEDLSPRDLARLGFALQASGAASDAVDLLRAGRGRHPESLWIQLRLALALQRLEPAALDEALASYTAALVLRPDCPGSRRRVAALLAHEERYEEAVGELGTLARVAPKAAREWLTLVRQRYDQARSEDPLWRGFLADATDLLRQGGG